MTYLILLMNIFQDFNFSPWFEQGPNLILKKEMSERKTFYFQK